MRFPVPIWGSGDSSSGFFSIEVFDHEKGEWRETWPIVGEPYDLTLALREVRQLASEGEQVRLTVKLRKEDAP